MSSMPTGLRRRTPILMLALASACATARTPVHEVLAPRADVQPRATVEPSATGSVLDLALRLQDKADREARIARAALRSGTPDMEARLEASRALLVSADVRIQRAALEFSENETLERTVLAEEHIGPEVRGAVLALSEEGGLLAAEALAQQPENCEARVLQVTHLSLVAWSESLGRSLLKGRAQALKEAVVAVADACPEQDSAAALRLHGRFRMEAPWPHGDSAEAIRLLEEAAESAPVPLTLLLLGDARYLSRNEAGAREAWTRAVAAEPDAANELSAPLYTELARRRLSRLTPE